MAFKYPGPRTHLRTHQLTARIIGQARALDSALPPDTLEDYLHRVLPPEPTT
ncbi:hypothetical protein [Streptodolium elevatio]|uniref:Uncharacterized protein n=1 Tax=Streptodolium elevatio TaxID=3157996 RepID=A0ABV3DL77_9ACTN